MFEYEKPFAEIIDLTPNEMIMNEMSSVIPGDGWGDGESNEDW